MKSQIETQEAIRPYLLGTLAPEQAVAFEERLLIDTELYEELLIAEDELVDQFVSGEMPAAERVRIETHFLRAPERQQQLRFARTLKRYVSDNTAQRGAEEEALAASPGVERLPARKRTFASLPRNPAIAFALVCTLVVLIIGGVWLASRILNRPNEPQTVWAIELTPGLQRDDSEIKNVAIPANVDAVRLQLALAEDQHESYEAVVLDIDGRSVATTKNLKAQPANGRLMVSVEVRAALLTPGSYRVKLSGLSANGTLNGLDSYPFRVLKK